MNLLPLLPLALLAGLPAVEYWFNERGVRIHKRVDYYLLAYVDGDPAELQKYKQNVLEQLRSRVKIAGFRSNKAPLELIVKTVDRFKVVNESLGREIGEQRNYSDEVAKQIDEEVRAIIDKAYERAVDVLTHSEPAAANALGLALPARAANRVIVGPYPSDAPWMRIAGVATTPSAPLSPPRLAI